MPLINTSLPNLIQGVSQQPDAVRYDGQCEEQENALSSVVDGLQKRPATEFIHNSTTGLDPLIDGTVPANTMFHVYRRTAGEKYIITHDGSIYVSLMLTAVSYVLLLKILLQILQSITTP